MSMFETERRARAPVGSLRFRPDLVVLLLLIYLALSPHADAQPSSLPASDPAPLTAEQVVRNLVQMNVHRALLLHGFEGTRIYRAEYHGVGGARNAEMRVSVKYLSPASKEFTVHSATGSKLIIDHVFRKLLEAEQEALNVEMQRRSALNDDNYSFTLVGLENPTSNAQYVLEVEPRKIDKFLYRGKIWVDATDFAVVRVQGEPAKNPSFWTKKSEIVQEYKKVADFWLPALNHSVSAIRLGGHAELTIEYQNYDITAAGQVNGERKLPATSVTEGVRAQQ